MGTENDVIAARIRERIKDMRTNATAVARDMGAPMGFLTDILSGRKHGFGAGHLAALADALDCDPEFIIGRQPNPRRNGGGELRLSGTIEADAWRRADRDPWAGRVSPGSPDPRFTASAQSFWRTQGCHERAGWPSGALVCTVPLDAARPAPMGLHAGDAVVIEWRSGDLTKREAARVCSPEGRARPVAVRLSGDAEELVIPPEGGSIIGVVVKVTFAYD